MIVDFGDNKCSHSNILENAENISVCQDCGFEITNRITNLPCSFYRDKDSGSVSYDPTRYTVRSDCDKGIFKELNDLKTFHTPEINEIFNKVFVKNNKTKNQHQINRGDNRKSLIFACVEYVYEKYNLNFNKEDTILKLNITKKDAAKGSRLLSLNFNKIGEKRPQIKSPLKKINDYINKMDKLKSNPDEHLANIEEIYNRIKNRSRVLIGAKPSSLNAGLLYYYLKDYIDKSNHNSFIITDISEIHELSGISVATIKKIYDDIKQVIEKI